ncbi:MAG: Na(+)-translocating NADH-quinone reductase subunit A [Marinifilaceae bacterium]|jgi:Na+-transporting NADH:ubiquinone oxidoreductase subunit A|nr:Na(+)-translocating NADH-quinone reductase subunit A [Marinifilaceae bacterium]
MSEVIKVKKGLNIKLLGKAEKFIRQTETPDTFAVKPTDFVGLTPKLKVKVDTEVKAGTALFFDKYAPEINFVSPVSGKVIAINRGERRKVLEIVVQKDNEIKYEEFDTSNYAKFNQQEICEKLQESGLWTFIKQRPYDIIARPNQTPKCIVVSSFDTNPLGADVDYLLENDKNDLQIGLDILSKLTEGKVHFNLHKDLNNNKDLESLKNVQINKFSGKHPASNVGVQLHHLDPVNKGEVAWGLSAQDVVFIGRFFNTGKVDLRRRVAICGSEVKETCYIETIAGANIKNLLKANLKDSEKIRIISGNVLTGTHIQENGYLGFYHSQITVIPEGDKHQFVGWAMPNLNKFSLSKSYFSWLSPNKQYRLDANLNGEHRAYVMSGEYEKVLPMDILPVYLIKSILVEDIDQMEQLGIYEVAPEDFALCEFVCTSKIEAQSIIRKGIELMIKEMS